MLSDAKMLAARGIGAFGSRGVDSLREMRDSALGRILSAYNHTS